MKNILIISASAGAGHVRAAEAIKKTAGTTYPNLNVRHIDLMDYISLPVKKMVGTYNILVKQAPELWGFMYEKTNAPGITKQLKKMSKKMRKLNAQKLNEYIKKQTPDYILFTHFLPPDLIDQELFGHIPTGTLITDYDLHELWINNKESHYFVGSKKISWKLEKRGINKNKITVSGLPVDLIFYQEKNKKALLEKYNISNSKPIILVLSGGHGLGHSDKIVKALFKKKEEVTIIAIAGQNEDLYKKLQHLTPPKYIDYTVLNWTDSIDEYMRIADIIVSKPGGMTTTECSILEKYMIAVDPIPGQEEQNSRYIMEKGFGAIANNAEDLLFLIEEELEKPHIIKKKEQVSAAEIILEQIQK